MENIRPCPYCGGEVEMVKLIKRNNEKRQPYRIQCMKCHKLVARGEGFEIETLTEAKDRINDYNKEMERIWSPVSSTKIKQTDTAKARDWMAENADMFGPDDELGEIHDASHLIAVSREMS